MQLSSEKVRNDESQKQISALKVELEDKVKAFDTLKTENENMIAMHNQQLDYNKQGIPIVPLSKSCTISETVQSLQLSNSSNRTGPLAGNTLTVNSNGNANVVKELNSMIKKNQELRLQCQALLENTEYLKLREKKLKYFIKVMEDKGYPVRKVY